MMKSSIMLIMILTAVMTACDEQGGNQVSEADSPAITEVTVAHPTDTVKLRDVIMLNATATYLLKSDVKANITGYINAMSIKLGDPVKRDQTLFVLKTKEAQALGNTIDQLDQSFKFSGVTRVVSPATGFVASLNHQIGDYVQDGEVLANIADASSFGFLVEVPFEFLKTIRKMKNLPIILPGGSSVMGRIAKVMPTADPVAQTVKVLLKTDGKDIPENIIGTISFPTTVNYGLSIPKTAVLSDETQSSYWVMRLINDTTAVKSPVIIGGQTDKYIQIKSGDLTIKDRIITSGNFGLNDTASVKIRN